MTDYIVMGIILLILGADIAYIVKSKKNGVKCIGCPDGAKCGGKSCGQCSCGCKSETDNEEK